jgi:hypothetical protein
MLVLKLIPVMYSSEINSPIKSFIDLHNKIYPLYTKKNFYFYAEYVIKKFNGDTIKNMVLCVIICQNINFIKIKIFFNGDISK